MTRHFTVTLSAPGQPCGFIWVCNWCGAESETPATLHRDLVTGASAHLGTCWPYLRHEIGRASDTWAYSCMNCRTTYRGSRDPETPWASVLDTALEHPKHCPGDPFERLWKQVSAQ